MRKSIAIVVAGVCMVAGVLGLQSQAQDKAPDKVADKAPAMPGGMDMNAMMKAWEAYATPGPEHAHLAKMAGEWDTFVEDLTPGMGNEKSTGSASSKMIMGGRFLLEEFKGTMMGQPFEGMALLGYDNIRKEYVSTWIDTMGTGVAVMYGTMPNKTTMDMAGECSCPMLDKPMKMVSSTVSESDDKHVMTMNMSSQDGQPMGAMRITYTRKK
jgi:Protein of unknown function (DUF1579)